MRILFWNMGRRNSSSILASMLQDAPCEIVLLCEFRGDSGRLLAEINTGHFSYREDALANSRLRLLTTLDADCIKHITDMNRVSYWAVQTDTECFLLCGAHLVSGAQNQRIDRNQLLGRIRDDMINVESQVGHDRSVVIGDLNLNPYDDMLMSSEGMHALSSLKATEKGARIVQGQSCPFFYNPMWSLFGDRSAGPPGTYFWQTSAPTGYGWNMLDQVLIRPSLMKSFVDFEVDILTVAGKNSLLTRSGRPRKSFSDHLPIRIHWVTGPTS